MLIYLLASPGFLFLPWLFQQLTEAYSTFSRMTLEVRKNKADDVFFLIRHLLV